MHEGMVVEIFWPDGTRYFPADHETFESMLLNGWLTQGPDMVMKLTERGVARMEAIEIQGFPVRR